MSNIHFEAQHAIKTHRDTLISILTVIDETTIGIVQDLRMRSIFMFKILKIPKIQMSVSLRVFIACRASKCVLDTKYETFGKQTNFCHFWFI